MEKVTFFETTEPITNEVTEHAVIDKGNGEFTTMLKSEYDRQQAEQSTPSLTDANKL